MPGLTAAAAGVAGAADGEAPGAGLAIDDCAPCSGGVGATAGRAGTAVATDAGVTARAGKNASAMMPANAMEVIHEETRLSVLSTDAIDPMLTCKDGNSQEAMRVPLPFSFDNERGENADCILAPSHEGAVAYFPLQRFPRSKGMDGFENDRRSLRAKLDVDRREMLAASLSVGFAAAVYPVAAQTVVHTNSEGLEAGVVGIPAADRDVPAYRAMPAKPGTFPVVIVVQEIFGVHEHIRDLCRRLAKQGYMAIAPELYVRQGSVADQTDIQKIIAEVVSKVPDAQVMSDLDATVAYAKNSGHGDASKLGIAGFCWGGRIVWLYAAHSSELKAGVAWYGKLAGDASANTPRHPIDVVAELRAPVLGLYGGADQGIPVDTVERMRAACKAATRECEFIVYPDTPHAFNADYRPSFRPEAAKDGWARMLAWFHAHGVV